MHTDAVVAKRAGCLERAPVPLRAPEPHEALVRVRYGGICGSDLHYWRDGRVGGNVLTAPLVLGHEIVGVVETASTDGLSPPAGAAVFVHPASTCGACSFCRAGRRNLCPDLRYLGSAARDPHVAGGFADRVVVGASRLLPIEEIPLERAALIEPASVAWHAVTRVMRLAQVDGARVAVIGSGPIGLLCVAVLRARCRPGLIVSTDIHPRPLALAVSVGANEALAACDTATREAAFDVVLETSGTEPGLATAMRLAAPAATIVAVGQLPDPTSGPLHLAVTRELTLIGSSRFSDEAEEVIVALRDGSLQVDGIVTHTLPAARAVEAFELAGDASLSSKVLLDFGAPAEHPAATP